MSGGTIDLREKQRLFSVFADQIQGQIYVTYYSMDSNRVDPKVSLFWPERKLSQSFSYSADPFNTATPLMPPYFQLGAPW